MTIQLFTLIHVLISLVGIAAGFGWLSGMLAGKILPRWTAVFLAMTLATSVTGFFFPFNGFTPAIAVGVLSTLALAVACHSLYIARLRGAGRLIFVISAILSLYLNTFVLIVQLFQKMPALAHLAPTQSEPPFAITQGLVLIAFIAMGIAAARRDIRT